MQTFKRQLLHWWNGLVNGCVRGGAVALKAFLGAAVASQAGMLPPLDGKQVLSVLAGAWLLSAAEYITNNPLPEIPEEPSQPVKLI